MILDFLRWNSTDTFSLLEIACLSLGIEPSDEANYPQVNSLLCVLEKAYVNARKSSLKTFQEIKLDKKRGQASTNRYGYEDGFTFYGTLPSVQLKRSFAKALADPEKQDLIPMSEDLMLFYRDDVDWFL